MRVKKYLENFDEIFNTDIATELSIEKYPILKMVLRNLAEYFYKLNNEQQDISKRLLNLENAFINSFPDYKKQIIDEFLEIETESKAELAERMLVFGYALAYEELKEMDALK